MTFKWTLDSKGLEHMKVVRPSLQSGTSKSNIVCTKNDFDIKLRLACDFFNFLYHQL